MSPVLCLLLIAQTTQVYRGVVVLDAKRELPFFLELPAGSSGAASIFNGPYRSTGDFSRNGDRIEIRYPEFETILTARVAPDGRMDGRFARESKAWGTEELVFRGATADRRDDRLLFGETNKAAAKPFLGKWKILDGSETGSVEIVLQDGVVFGHFFTKELVSIMFYGGVVKGELNVVSFDGQFSYLIQARITKRGRLEGRWYTGNAKPRRLAAVLDPSFVVGGAPSAAITGRKLRAPGFSDAKYRGKPLIVQIAGSWCPHCHEATDFLRNHVAKSNGSIGVVTLCYEYTGDAEHNREKALMYKTRHRLPWDVVAIDGEYVDAVELLPDGFETLPLPFGVPTLLFIDPAGTIRAVQPGYPKEGTARHPEYVRELDANLAMIRK